MRFSSRQRVGWILVLTGILALSAFFPAVAKDRNEKGETPEQTTTEAAPSETADSTDPAAGEPTVTDPAPAEPTDVAQTAEATDPAADEGPTANSFQASALATVAVDGNLESDYNIGTASSINYTRDQSGTLTGRISILEDDTNYYIGFMQALDAKSNAYCADENTSEGCYQDFGKLVGSDYISFTWEISGNEIFVPVDTISPSTTAESGYATVPGEDGGDISGIDASGVQVKSAMDFNLNGHDWRDFTNSPNYAGQPDHPYIYPSIAEVGISKAALAAVLGGDGSGLVNDLANAVVVVHNSPSAPTQGPPVPFIECPTGQARSGTAGSNVSLDVKVTEDGLPLNNASVLAFVASGPGSIVSVGGTAGAQGFTGADGIASIVVTSPSAGTTQIRAEHDVDGDGTWDQGSDPETAPLCPIVWTAAAAESFDFEITKTVDKAEALRGDPLLYTVRVTNTGTGTLTNLVITDAIPTGTTYITGSASDAGVFDTVANSLTWRFSTLAPGVSVTVTFRVTINANAPDTVLNVAVARTDQVGPKEARVTTRLPTVGAGDLQRTPAVAQEVVAGAPLARTGVASPLFALMALALIGLGLVLAGPQVDLMGSLTARA